MTVEYTTAVEAQKIAKKAIGAHHKHLANVRVEYVFRDKHQTSGGKEVWAKTRKVSGLHAYLASESQEVDAAPGESFFVVEFARDVWNLLDKESRDALVDHELCKCGAEFNEDGDLSLKVRPHDVEEFAAVISRHGLWRTDVERLVKAAVESGQLTFDDALDEKAGDAE